MYLTSDKAFEMLMKLFKEHPDLDSASVLVLWGDEIREHDEKIADSIRHNLPQRYTVQHGTMQPQNTDDGRQFYAYVPDAKYRVDRDDIAEFAKSIGVPLPSLMAVLNGDELEVDGYRTYHQLGSMSKEYRVPRDLTADDFHNEKVKPAREPYKTAPVAIEQDWSR